MTPSHCLYGNGLEFRGNGPWGLSSVGIPDRGSRTFQMCVTAKARSQEAGEDGPGGARDSDAGLWSLLFGYSGNSPLMSLSLNVPTCQLGIIPALSRCQDKWGCQTEYRNERGFSSRGLHKWRVWSSRGPTPGTLACYPCPHHSL